MATKRAGKRTATTMSSESNEDTSKDCQKKLDELVAIRQEELMLKKEQMEILRDARMAQKLEYEDRRKARERKEMEKQKRQEKKQEERQMKWTILQDLMIRTGSLSAQEEVMKDALIKEFLSG